MRPNTLRWVCAFDRALKTLIPQAHPQPQRPYPAQQKSETIFQATAAQLKESRYQMRINHTGEVCAQALYDGHFSPAIESDQQRWLRQAREEEVEHLIWCHRRLKEIGGSGSLLNPLFYGMSFAMASALSTINPQWNMQFIRETESQVFDHLNEQLTRLNFDARSSAIIEQMCLDEKEHEQGAANFEPAPFPPWAQRAMKVTAKVMKTLVRWV